MERFLADLDGLGAFQNKDDCRLRQADSMNSMALAKREHAEKRQVGQAGIELGSRENFSDASAQLCCFHEEGVASGLWLFKPDSGGLEAFFYRELDGCCILRERRFFLRVTTKPSQIHV